MYLSDKMSGTTPTFSLTFSLTFFAAVAALAGIEIPPGFADNLMPFEFFKTLKDLYINIMSEEKFKIFVTNLFFAQLLEMLTQENTQKPIHQCQPGCACCLHVEHCRNHRARSDANYRVARLIQDPSSAESSELLEKYAETVLKAVCDHLGSKMSKCNITLRAVNAALAGVEFPPPEFADKLKGFKFFETLKILHKIMNVEKEFGSFVNSLFIPQLLEMLTQENTQKPIHQCQPGCACCLHVEHCRNHRARSDANARVARLIQDPSSAESSELLEKYAETALKAVCDHLISNV